MIKYIMKNMTNRYLIYIIDKHGCTMKTNHSLPKHQKDIMVLMHIRNSFYTKLFCYFSSRLQKKKKKYDNSN